MYDPGVLGSLHQVLIKPSVLSIHCSQCILRLPCTWPRRGGLWQECCVGSVLDALASCLDMGTCVCGQMEADVLEAKLQDPSFA